MSLPTKDIKTYAVTPLNEECGLIEWVDNLRTLRDLVTKLLRERGITPNVRAPSTSSRADQARALERMLIITSTKKSANI